MNENLTLALSLGVGVLLGVFFFWGLWLTVQIGINSKRPAVWFLSSMLIRTGLVLAGFYVVSAGHWQRFLACLLGFTLARFILARYTPFGQSSRNQHP